MQGGTRHRAELDSSNALANAESVRRDAPYAPPIISLADGTVRHLLAWELTEVDGFQGAWVSWVQHASGRRVHKVVTVRATQLQPLEPPESYSSVRRRVRGRDGVIRPWSGKVPT